MFDKHAIALLTLLACSTVQAQTVTVSTNRPSPFMGEVISITLEIASDGKLREQILVIPWSKSAGEEKEPDWVQRYQKQDATALPVLYGGKRLFVPQQRPGVYQLRWSLVVPEASEEPALTLAPITWGTVRSNTLTLEVRRPPPLLQSASTWNLGLGNYQVTARWKPDRVVLGEETTLELIVSGSGNLAAIAPPVLSSSPGWEASRVLVESAGSILQEGSRVFRFRIRPRQLQLRLSPLTVASFDPLREVMISERVTLPNLSISSSTAKVPAGHTVEDASQHLPEAEAGFLMLMQHVKMDPFITFATAALPWIVLSWAGYLILHLALARFAPQLLQQWRRRKVIDSFLYSLTYPLAQEPRAIRQLLDRFAQNMEWSPQQIAERTSELHAQLDRWEFGIPQGSDAATTHAHLKTHLNQWRAEL